jgi:oxygen-independent coproporphyrinogen-3 oxidase
MRLICHFALDFASVESTWGLDFHAYFAASLPRLEEMASDRLLDMDDRGIQVLPKGRLLIRNVCMAFDAYRLAQPSAGGFLMGAAPSAPR